MNSDFKINLPDFADNIKFHRMELMLNIHTTEDLNKYIEIFKSYFPESVKLSKNLLNVSNVSGGYGNLIRIVNYTTQDNTIIEYLIGKIIQNMQEIERDKLWNKFPYIINEKNEIFLRISKKSLFLNNLKITSSDVLRIKIKLIVKDKRLRKRDDFFQILINLFKNLAK